MSPTTRDGVTKLKKQTVVRALNPMNPLRWNCELECGHEVWVTGKRAPKKAMCPVKACGVVRR